MILEHPVDPRIQAMLEADGAQRVALLPRTHKLGNIVGGSYRTAFVTGSTTVLNAGDAIVSMRWTDPDREFVLRQLRCASVILTAFGAAQELSVDLVRVTGFTANDTGGTDVGADLLAGAGRSRTSMPYSSVTDLRVASATALGAGTGSAEGRPLGYQVLPYVLNAVGATGVGDLFHAHPGDDEITFRRNEGFRVRIGFTQGATGVVKFAFELEWAEEPLEAA